MRIFLTSYRPLCRNAVGLKRARRHGIPPFVDASCRREPDFESKAPSITSLCRGRNFAPRLQQGDVVVYITVMGHYLGGLPKSWRFSAVLKVTHRFSSHEVAADWYRARQIILPSNCLVPGNRPLPAYMTAYTSGRCNAVMKEDRVYQQRAREYGAFLVCGVLYRELVDPPEISRHIMQKAFGRVPKTRTPSTIEPQELRSLVEQLGIETRVEDFDLICSR